MKDRPAVPPLALIFDLDGVLIDSEPLHQRAKEKALAEFGIVLSDQVYDLHKGRPDDVVLREMLEHCGRPEILANLRQRKRELFQSMEQEIKPVTGAVDFVRWAKTRFRLALATSSTARNRDMAFRLLGIQDQFDSVVDAGRHQRPKPDPEVFLIAMKDLGLPPKACWIIEDSLNGVVAAQAAGCVTVGITTTFSAAALENAGVDVAVRSFAELRSLIDRL